MRDMESALYNFMYVDVGSKRYLHTPHLHALQDFMNILCEVRTLEWRHNDVTWASLRFKSPLTRMVVQQLVRANNRTKYQHDDVIKWKHFPRYFVKSIVYSGADQRKYQSSASLAFVRGIHRWPVNSPHKGPVTRNMFPFDDVIMTKASDVELWFFLSSAPEQTLEQTIETTVIWDTAAPIMTSLRWKFHFRMHFVEWRYMNFD